MSIRFTNGYGTVLCKWCNHAVITGSNTDYKKCNNCGGLHGINNHKPIVYKPVYNWYYIKSLIFGL